MRWIVRAVVAALLSLAAWFTWQAYHIYTDVHAVVGHTEPTAVGETPVVIPPLNGNQRTNFLILGSDNDKKLEEKRPLAQSIIVVSVDPRTDRVVMLSIPRDFYVPIQGHGMQKIDLAYKYGGVTLARATIHRLFGIPIHYYAWVGLDGFIKVIDTLGGVTLDISHPILDDSYPDDLNSANPYGYKRIFIPAGWQHLSGDQALEYVRSRHGDLIGDFGRSARQQQVLLQLDRKATAWNVLMNLPDLADELSQSVKTDVGLSQLPALEQLMRKVRPQDVHQVVLQAPTYSTYAWVGQQSILKPNWQRIRPLIAQLFGLSHASKSKSSGPGGPHHAPHFGPTPVSSAGTTVPSRPASTASPPPTVRPTPTVTPTPTAPDVRRLPGRLLFVSGNNLFLVGPTGETHQLTSTSDVAMASPSPDGKQVALVRFDTRHYLSNIWLLDLKTLKERQVTNDLSPDNEVRNNLWAAWPTWSADGRTLLFSWDRAKLALPPSDARPVDLAIWRINVDGSNPVQITVPTRGTGGDADGTSRPGSSQFVYIKWSYLQSSNQPYSQLALADPVAGTTSLLTPIGGRVLQASWDRGGKRLTFVRQDPRGVNQVVAAPVVSGKRGPVLGARVVLASGDVANPAFSPDGRFVSYLRRDGDGFRLYLVPAQGGRPRLIPAVPSVVDARWRPVWLP